MDKIDVEAVREWLEKARDTASLLHSRNRAADAIALIDQLTAEVSSLQRGIEHTAEREFEALKQRNAATADKETLRVERDEKDAETERLKVRCAELTDRSEFDKGDIRILRTRAEQAEDQRDALQAKVEVLEKTVRAFNNGMSAMTSKDVAAENVALQAKVDAMQAAMGGASEWLDSIADSDLTDIVADGGITAGMVVQQEAREQSRRLRHHLPKPADPLVEVIRELRPDDHDRAADWAGDLRKAIVSRGGTITFPEDRP